MKKIWDFFNSLRLTVYLGLLLCALFWLGSIYLLRHGAALEGLHVGILLPWLAGEGIKGFSANWWLWLIILTLVFLAINTLVCSIDRLTKLLPRVFAPKFATDPAWLDKLSIKREMKLNVPLEEAKKTLQRVFFFKGFKKVRCHDQPPGSSLVYAQSGRFVVLAPYLVHLGFLLVLTGHLISSCWGFKSFGHKVEQGEKISIPHSDFQLRLNSIAPCSKNDTSLCSEIVILKDDRVLRTSVIGVNKPLLYQGLTFYQAARERALKGIGLTLTQKGGKQSITLKEGEEKSITDEISILPYAVLPDFAFSPEGVPTSRSESYNNPALLLIILKNKIPIEQGWLFLNNRNYQELTYADFRIKFNGISTNSILVLNIVRNPGAFTVLAGGILFIIAGAWVLLGNYRRLWFYLAEREDGLRLICGGMASQRRTKLRADLSTICDALDKRLS